MITFIDHNVHSYGVEPICVLPIAPSTYYEHVAQRQDSTRLSARARQDGTMTDCQFSLKDRHVTEKELDAVLNEWTTSPQHYERVACSPSPRDN